MCLRMVNWLSHVLSLRQLVPTEPRHEFEHRICPFLCHKSRYVGVSRCLMPEFLDFIVAVLLCFLTERTMYKIPS